VIKNKDEAKDEASNMIGTEGMSGDSSIAKAHLILEDVQYGGFEPVVHADVREAFIQMFSALFPFFLTLNTCCEL
jgi:hypothetical protein